MPKHELDVRAVISGRPVTRAAITDWEARRVYRAARKIGVPVPSGDLARRRRALAESKLALGPDEICRRLARDIRLSDTTARALVRVSRGRRATSVCDLYVGGGTAEEFVEWFTATGRSDYARSMIGAHPDHFVIDTAPDGRQEVVETTGGSPFATRFFVDYDDTSTLVTPRDPAFPVELAGVARADSGLAIGGVRHQFRNERTGFRARLCVEFPALTPPHMIARHRWHLACEFGNWIESAFDVD